MVIVDNVVVTSDVIQEHFVCDLAKCKGACCVEGDLGAPLEQDELVKINDVIEIVKPYLGFEANSILEKDGAYILDDEGDYSTTTIMGAECVFAVYDEKSILKCAIEQAYKDGKTNFRKPISCHLYPIRVKKLGEYEALNYDRWSICAPACELGKSAKIPLFEFLENALIRKYGIDWYEGLKKVLDYDH